jgi:hypothetical protein
MRLAYSLGEISDRIAQTAQENNRMIADKGFKVLRERPVIVGKRVNDFHTVGKISDHDATEVQLNVPPGPAIVERQKRVKEIFE